MKNEPDELEKENVYSYTRIADPKQKASKRKFVCWGLNKFQYVKWCIRLQFDRIRRDSFIAGLIELYLDKDPDMVKCVEKIRNKHFKGCKTNLKAINERIQKLFNREIKLMKSLGLSQDEMDEISNNLAEYLPKDIQDFSK